MLSLATKYPNLCSEIRENEFCRKHGLELTEHVAECRTRPQKDL
jgi:hypothetical protein